MKFQLNCERWEDVDNCLAIYTQIHTHTQAGARHVNERLATKKSRSSLISGSCSGKQTNKSEEEEEVVVEEYTHTHTHAYKQ